MPKLPQHIEKLFDEKFKIFDTGWTVPPVITAEILEQIKSFIATILDEERQKMLEKIDKAKTYSVRNGGLYEWHCPLCHRTGDNIKHICIGVSKSPCDETCGEWFKKNLIKEDK